MPGSSPSPPVASPPDSRHNCNHKHATTNPNPNPNLTSTARTHAPEHTAPHAPRRQPFSWSSSLLTMLTTLGCFAILCALASSASTRFALHAAAPVYGLYPPLVATMLVGGCAALICYLPTMLAVLAFYVLFGADIRKRHSPPPGLHAQGQQQGGAMAAIGEEGVGTGMGMGWSVLRDGASTIKLALVVAPAYEMALGRSGTVLGVGLGAVKSRALDAAAGGQLAAAVMTLRIMLVGVCEIWDLVPLVMFRWDRDARAQEQEREHEHE